MSLGILILILGFLTLGGFFLGRLRAVSMVDYDARKLHSLPNFYGGMVAIFIALPAFFVFCAWTLLQPVLIEQRVISNIAIVDITEGSNRTLVMADVRRIAEGLDRALALGGLSEQDLLKFDTTQSDANALLATAGVALGREVQPSVFDAASLSFNVEISTVGYVCLCA